MAAQQFIDKLAELSGGKIKVAHHHSGALGGEREVVQQIQLGAVDIRPDHDGAAVDGDARDVGVPAALHLPRLRPRLQGARRQRHAHQVLRRRARQEGPEADRLHRRRLSRHLRPQRDQRPGRHQGQEGARAGGQDPGRHVQGAGHDLDADRLPRGGDGAADQGDRLRRRRRQHLLPQQVLRHREVRGRRASHPPGGGADHVEGGVVQARSRRPEGGDGRLGARPHLQPQVHPRRGQGASRSRSRPRA